MSLLSKLKVQEGFSATPYRDTEGNLTWGYGTKIERISESEAEFLLEYRLEIYKAELLRKEPWIDNLDQARKDVFYNMAYNLGVPNLLGFRKMIGHARLGEWKDAAREGLDSKWAVQVKGRAIELMKQLETGTER